MQFLQLEFLHRVSPYFHSALEFQEGALDLGVDAFYWRREKVRRFRPLTSLLPRLRHEVWLGLHADRGPVKL